MHEQQKQQWQSDEWCYVHRLHLKGISYHIDLSLSVLYPVTADQQAVRIDSVRSTRDQRT